MKLAILTIITKVKGLLSLVTPYFSFLNFQNILVNFLEKFKLNFL